MAAFALPTLAVGAVVLLAAAGVAHTTQPARLRAALDRQALLPRRVRAALARVLGPAELLLAATAPLGSGPAVALLGAAFLVHLLVLLAARPDAPCGCTGDDAAVTPFDLGRALLVLAGGLALVADPSDLGAAEQLTVVVAGVALALAVDLVARSQRPLLTLGREP
jgi:hypothetical protein